MKKTLFISIMMAALFFGCSDNSSKERKKKIESPDSSSVVIQKTKEAPQKKVTEKKVEAVAKKTEETPKEIVAKQVKSAVEEEASVDGKALYSKCSACHGEKGEKKALGKSQIIQGWDAEKTKNALEGYQNGSYGGVLKGLMKSQLTGLTDKDIKSLAKYISKL